MKRDGGRGTRDGYTLVEVIVVLAIIGIVVGVSAMALASLRLPTGAETERALIAARDSAIRSGIPVSVTVSVRDSVAYHSPLPTPMLFLPDGRAIGPMVDPLTGVPLALR